MLQLKHRGRNAQICIYAERALRLCPEVDDEQTFQQERPLKLLLQRNRQPLRIATLGESGTGKSSVLAAATNIPYIATHAMEGSALRWTYSAGDAESIPSRYVMNPKLLGIELWDTAGIEKQELQQELLPLFEEMDILIIVFHAQHIQSPHTWATLKSLPPEQLQHCVIALTHEETLPTDQALKIREELFARCIEELNTRLPLCPVIAGGNNPGGGIQVLTQRIQSLLDAHTLIPERLENIRQLAIHLMDEQANILRDRERISRADSGFLDGIDREVDSIQIRGKELIPGQVEVYGHIAQELIPRLARKLSALLGHIISPIHILQMKGVAVDVERWFFEILRMKIEEKQEASDRSFISYCEQHWENVRPRMKNSLSRDIGEFPQKLLLEDCKLLRQQLGRDLYAPLNRFGLRGFLVAILCEEMAWMRKLICLCLLFVLIGGTMGIFGETYLGGIMVAMAIGIWIFSSLFLVWEKKRLITRVNSAGEELHVVIKEAVEPLLEIYNASRTTNYRRLFTNMRRKVSEDKEHLAPLLKRQRGIYFDLLSLK